MTILVVDDDSDSRALVQALLRREGYRDIACVDRAQPALAALTGTRAEAGRIAAVLLNVRMPEMDGIAACRRIRAIPGCADLPVLMVSTQRDPEVIRAAYAAGASDYLYKPIDRSALAVRLRSALALREEFARREARERDLARVGAELERSLAAIRGDLEAAARLQRSLLPEADLRLRGVRAAMHFAPCAQIGGDMLGVVPLTEGLVAFYLLDVSGHGVPAALRAVAVRHLLSAPGYMTTAEGTPRAPDAVLALLNAEFARDSSGGEYFTMTYGLLDVAGRSLDYAHAGHPGMAVATPDGQCRYLAEGDLPIGLFENARYRTHRVPLEPRTRLIAYSDGVIETAAAQSGALYGEDRLAAAIAAGAHLALPELLARVARELDAWRGSAPAQDDVSMLALELE